MTSRHPPTIGISCTEIETGSTQHPPRLGQNRSYLNAVTRAGAVPFLIPHLADQSRLRTLYEQADGLLLPGGIDIDPTFYDQTRHQKLGPVDPEQDETELTLTRWAMAESKPLLAICRGIQVLNVALGGSLYQDIQVQVPEAKKHNWHPGFPRDYLAHTVVIVPQTRLAQILGTTTLQVNSLHHQALQNVAPALTITARAPDQIIEAVEAPDHTFAVAVQWHPEELIDTDPYSQHLFTALVEACRP
jgi:putative glutamine amidotransferase